MKEHLVKLARRYPLAKALMKIPFPAYWEIQRILNKRTNEILKRIQEILVDDVVIEVEEFNGEFVISPKSRLFTRLVRDGYYEPEWSNRFLSFVKPGTDVIDVGANVGFYTVAAAKRGARVLSIEPTEGAFGRLQENVHRNGVDDRVVFFHGLISDTQGERELHVVDGMEEYSSMAPLQPNYVMGKESRLELASASTLDSLVRNLDLRPILIKVDTEGAEMLVFRGAKQTLETYRPIVMSELSDKLLAGFGTNCDEVVRMFHDLNYEVRLANGEPLRAGTDGYGEVLCVPN